MGMIEDMLARITPERLPNQQFRNSVFGNDTAAMPMPQYDDDMQRRGRRLQDMPELETRQWTPAVPSGTDARGQFNMGSPGYYSGIDPRMRESYPPVPEQPEQSEGGQQVAPVSPNRQQRTDVRGGLMREMILRQLMQQQR